MTDQIIINPFDKGYVQIYTGDGKGKTTAALGLALRAAGAGLRVYIGQFVKSMEYSEISIIRSRIPEITVELFGDEEGCLIDRAASSEDFRCAKAGLNRAEEILRSGDYDLVILDEVTIPVSMGLLEEEKVLDLIRNKPDDVELVITGRGATKKMLDAADLVSDVREVRHYYQQGVLSRRGIEC